MDNTMEQYTQLANLFDFPRKEYVARAAKVKTYLDENYPDISPELDEFMDFIADSSPEEREEIYLRTFEVQGIATLDVGYVLFGDDYKRGACLVNLNREHRETENETNGELADHLPAVLRLLPKMTNKEVAAELIEMLVMPALAKMIGSFSSDTLKKKNKVYKKHHTLLIETNVKYALVYLIPLMVLSKVMERDHTIIEAIAPGKNADFLGNINTELVNADK